MRLRQAAVIAATALMPVAAQESKPTSPTPAAIIERHLAAIGGRDALRPVKTMVVRGRNASLGAADRPLIRYLKPPHLFIEDGVTLNAALDDGLFLKRADSGEVVPTIAPGSDTRPFRHYAQ